VELDSLYATPPPHIFYQTHPQTFFNVWSSAVSLDNHNSPFKSSTRSYQFTNSFSDTIPKESQQKKLGSADIPSVDPVTHQSTRYRSSFLLTTGPVARIFPSTCLFIFRNFIGLITKKPYLVCLASIHDTIIKCIPCKHNPNHFVDVVAIICSECLLLYS